MKSKKATLREARSLLRMSLAKDGSVDEGRVRTIIKKIVKLEGTGGLGTLQAYHRLIRLELGKSKATVTSATELKAGVKKQITTDLADKYGRKIDADFSVDPELVGGFVVRVGDDIFDSSVSTRLRKLQEAFQ